MRMNWIFSGYLAILAAHIVTMTLPLQPRNKPPTLCGVCSVPDSNTLAHRTLFVGGLVLTTAFQPVNPRPTSHTCVLHILWCFMFLCVGTTVHIRTSATSGEIKCQQSKSWWIMMVSKHIILDNPSTERCTCESTRHTVTSYKYMLNLKHLSVLKA